MLEPDFGTTVITVSLLGILLFMAGLHWGWVVTLGVVGGVVLSLAAVVAPYRLARITSFWDPFQDVQGGGHQVVQGWIAMASGGWTGQGIASGIWRNTAVRSHFQKFPSKSERNRSRFTTREKRPGISRVHARDRRSSGFRARIVSAPGRERGS